MTIVYVLLAVLAGAMLPLQAVINARLGRAVGSPVWAAAISGVVVTGVLAVAALLMTRAGPRMTGLGTLPWWAWTGGLCGAIVLSTTTTVAPRLGAASMIALVMSGQVLCSLALDNFGLFGLATQPAGLKRLFGAGLLLAGAALMR